MGWSAARSATCSSTTCVNASPPWTTRAWRRSRASWAACSGPTSSVTIQASTASICPSRSLPLGNSGCDLDGQMEAVDAWMVTLDVGPEQAAQEARERRQARVVQGGLAFTQVVDEQVADRAADQPVAVDQLGAGALPAGAQLAQRRGSVGTQHPHRVQRPVEQVGGPDRGAAGVRLDLQQLQDVAGGDVVEGSALGGQDQRGTVAGPA